MELYLDETPRIACLSIRERVMFWQNFTRGVVWPKFPENRSERAFPRLGIFLAPDRMAKAQARLWGSQGLLHLLIDSTGIKIEGEGE